MVHGNNIIILAGGVAVAGCKSHEITVNGEQIEIASPTSSKWREYIAGRIDWSINTNYLLTTVDNIRDVLKVNTTVTILIRDKGSTATLTGQAIVASCKQTHTTGNISQGAFSFKGTGALT